jgi:hypothetical protein
VSDPSSDKGGFEAESREKRTGLLAEFLHFLAHNKKWWLLPILLVILILAFLVLLGGTALAPFIYTIF